MLTVILKILSILGIILLVILGVLLVTLLLVLFFPICYRIKADRQPYISDAQPNDIKDAGQEFVNRADIKAWWLFGLLRAKFRYPEPGTLKVKLLFFTLYESAKIGPSESESDMANFDKSDATEVSSSEATKKSTKDAASPSEPPAQTIQSEVSSTKMDSIDASATTEKSKPGPIEKIQYTFRNICDKIKNIRDNIAYYKEVLLCDDTKELLKYAFKRLGKILKSIRPRKLRADIYFGTGSPDTTGYVFAGYGMLCSYLGKHVIVTPDFEQAILKGNVYAAGHITVFKILWNILMIVKDHRLWELKDKLTRK